MNSIAAQKYLESILNEPDGLLIRNDIEFIDVLDWKNKKFISNLPNESMRELMQFLCVCEQIVDEILDYDYELPIEGLYKFTNAWLLIRRKSVNSTDVLVQNVSKSEAVRLLNQEIENLVSKISGLDPLKDVPDFSADYERANQKLQSYRLRLSDLCSGS